MGKLVISDFVTVDGVFEDPGAWVQNRDEDGAIAEDAVGLFRELGTDCAPSSIEETYKAEALLFGRSSYEQFATLWPEREGRFADKMNSMPKYVVSASLENGEWEPTTVIGAADPVAEIGKLREDIDGDILVPASGRLVTLLLDKGLVDELRLRVFPVVLGRGRGLFDETATTQLELVEAKAIGGKGVVLHVYRPTA